MKILKTIIVIMIIAITKCFLLSFCCICLVCYTQVTSGINSWTSLSFHQILFAMGPWSLIYFLSIVLFGRFYLINLVLAVVAASYENEVQNSRQVSHKIFRRNSEIWCFNAISETRSIWPTGKFRCEVGPKQIFRKRSSGLSSNGSNTISYSTLSDED